MQIIHYQIMTEKLFAEIQHKHKDLWTSFSVDDLGLKFLLGEIVNKKRNNIIEFGSGLSTVCIAELIKSLSLDAKLTSVESDAYWLDKVRAHAALHDLSAYIEFIYAPVFPYHKMGAQNKWYSELILEEALTAGSVFDMVIVDGPIAYYHDIERSRYGAMPFMISKISKSCTFILDDCNRQGEQTVLGLWEKEFGMSFHLLENGRMAVGYSL